MSYLPAGGSYFTPFYFQLCDYIGILLCGASTGNYFKKLQLQTQYKRTIDNSKILKMGEWESKVN